MPHIFLVDAFSHGPFTGNPAGVCPLIHPAEDRWMQAVAAEMNQAETAFYWPLDDLGFRFGLRWFTPDGEVDLCGHATLATAHIIWSLLPSGAPRLDLEFETRSGALRISLNEDLISMDFPAEPADEAEVPITVPGAIWTGKNRMDWVCILSNANQVRDFEPDQATIAAAGMRGLLVTAPSDIDGVDFISRFFAPLFGIPEDSVTGSAHCCLAPLWASRLGKSEMRGYQASKRGGYVGVRLNGDRVQLSGKAVTFLAGQLQIPVN